jgi:hypothetical protein
VAAKAGLEHKVWNNRIVTEKFSLFFNLTSIKMCSSIRSIVKNSFRLNIGTKFILAVVLCLSFKAYSVRDGEDCVSFFDGNKHGTDSTAVVRELCPDCAAVPLELHLDPTVVPAAEVDSQKYVFVFACNEAYAGPTAVAIRSLMDTQSLWKNNTDFGL